MFCVSAQATRLKFHSQPPESYLRTSTTVACFICFNIGRRSRGKSRNWKPCREGKNTRDHPLHAKRRKFSNLPNGLVAVAFDINFKSANRHRLINILLAAKKLTQTEQILARGLRSVWLGRNRRCLCLAYDKKALYPCVDGMLTAKTIPPVTFKDTILRLCMEQEKKGKRGINLLSKSALDTPFDSPSNEPPFVNGCCNFARRKA